MGYIKSQHHEGFSLIELLLVVAIIGMLAAIAIPQFQRFAAKAKQVEAKSNLRHIYNLQLSYFSEVGAFCSKPDIGYQIPCLGFEVKGRPRYGYRTDTVVVSDSVYHGQNVPDLYFNATAQAFGSGTYSTNNIRPGCGLVDTWAVWYWSGYGGINETPPYSPHDCSL